MRFLILSEESHKIVLIAKWCVSDLQSCICNIKKYNTELRILVSIRP